MKIFKIVVLTLSGLALFYASATRLFNPAGAVFLQTYFQNPQNSLDIAIDLVSEIRGVGAVMLLGGILALLGAIRLEFRQTSFAVGSVIFGGVILGRLISFYIDGVPHQDLIRAAVAEAVLAVLNIFCLVRILLGSKKILSSRF